MPDRCGICHREPCRCCVEYIDTDIAGYIDTLKAERDRLRAALGWIEQGAKDIAESDRWQRATPPMRELRDAVIGLETRAKAAMTGGPDGK